MNAGLASSLAYSACCVLRLPSSFVRVRGVVDLEGEYPDYLEETLAYGAAQCVEFNRRGTLLAVGCKTGQIVMYAARCERNSLSPFGSTLVLSGALWLLGCSWDFLTRGVGKVLMDRHHVSTVLVVHWSRNGRKILAAYANGDVWRWDVVSGVVDARAHVVFGPNSPGPMSGPNPNASSSSSSSTGRMGRGGADLENVPRVISAQLHPVNLYDLRSASLPPSLTRLPFFVCVATCV
jgi:hypothetical protein